MVARSLTINYTAPFGTFVSSTAYFDRKTFESEDDTDFTEYSFGITPPLASPITREIDLRRFVQELRFASTFSGPFQMIFGGFYSDSTRPRDYEWNSTGVRRGHASPSNLHSVLRRLAGSDGRGACSGTCHTTCCPISRRR